MVDAGAAAGPRHGDPDRVQPHLLRTGARAPLAQPRCREAPQPGPLARPQALQGCHGAGPRGGGAARGPAGLHLHEDERVPVEGDQVDLADAGADVALEDPEAEALQVPAREPLPEGAELARDGPPGPAAAAGARVAGLRGVIGWKLGCGVGHPVDLCDQSAPAACPGRNGPRPGRVRTLGARAGGGALGAQLGLLGVADGPRDALDQLGGGVVAAEVDGLDALVEQHGDVLRQPGRVGRDDDAGHGLSFVPEGMGAASDPLDGGRPRR